MILNICVVGCSHMTCKSCGLHFCWNCCRPLHGDSILCKTLSVSNWEGWGSSIPERVATKACAIPAGIVVGSVGLGAAGIRA